MSEMAVTADEVVIIGRGRLIAQISIAELLGRSSQRYVRVRSPELEKLRAALDGQGAQTALEESALSVHGMDEVAIGDVAARLLVALHELSPQSASLEEAFMELTEESVEYHGKLRRRHKEQFDERHDHEQSLHAAVVGTSRPIQDG
jgi:ABC-2 type transport system ATP-binding protein